MLGVKRSTLLTLASGAMLWQSFLPQAVWADSNDLQSMGLSAYNRQDYTTAVRLLTGALQLKPSDQALHYYLANALIMDKQVESARYHYSIAYNLDPSSLIGKYCQSALSYGSAPSVNPEAKSYENLLRVDAARTQLIKQGRDVAQYRYNRGVTSAGNRMDLGQRQVQTIQNHENEMIDEMRSMRFGSPMVSIPQFSKADIEAVKMQYRGQEEQAKREAVYSAAARQTSASNKSTMIQESAEGLASQLSPNTNGFSLVPEGTNLFIRNYTSSTASPPSKVNQQELLATPEQLVLDPHFRPGKSTVHVLPGPFGARAGVLPKGNTINADLKVRGQLISPR